MVLQRALDEPLAAHHRGSSAEWEALSHRRAQTSSSASLGDPRCLRLPWEVWPEMTSYQPGLRALQGHFLLLGVLPANHTASLCPSSLLCEEGHT